MKRSLFFNASRCLAALLLVSCAFGLAHARDLRLEDLHQTRDRPLFSPTRRPPPKVEAVQTIVPVAPPPAPVLPPSLTLVGVIFGDDQQAVIVEEANDHKPIHLSLGDNIDGWIVISIAPRNVMFRRARRFFTLSFPAPTVASAPNAAVPPGVPNAASPPGIPNPARPPGIPNPASPPGVPNAASPPGVPDAAAPAPKAKWTRQSALLQNGSE